ncbi:hypothetical protein PHLGIDRAFT_36360 [Phlebiopsis gigantea 11061_1 CR5-6]|uniref:Transmembrane protein n=1 Tax=Phlebiopsis gigantea (strain 11061_1 CR5-6) TaxID=745531 RepID=A0A0C3NKP2_PHLG1|nr:hypothetical protein PHLGIDRAFT_36360 [Phlebiopsis gigantea 11061_1 CR5-6]
MVGLAFAASVLGSCIWMLAGDWHEAGQQWQAIVKDLYLAHVPPNDTLSDILDSSYMPSSTSYSSTTGPGHEPYRIAADYERKGPRVPLEHEHDAFQRFATPTIDAATRKEPSPDMDETIGEGADMFSSDLNAEDGTSIQWAEETSSLLAHLNASSQTPNTEFLYRNSGVVWRAEATYPESEIRHVAIPEVAPRVDNNCGDVLSRAEPSISHKPGAFKVELRLLPTLVLCSGWLLLLLSVLLRDPEDVVNRWKRTLRSVTGAAPTLENRYAAFDDYFWTEPHKPRPKPKVATSSVAEAQPKETSTTIPKSDQRVRSVTENPWARKEIPFAPSLLAQRARRRRSQGFDVGATVSISSLRSVFSGTNKPLFLRGQPNKSLEQEDERTIENRHCATCQCLRAGSSGKAST